jgi:signal recognition particle subunit SRP54
MGPLKDVLAMLPGSGSFLKQVEIEDRDIARLEGMIRSMTPAERRNPKLISGSRKRRIAAGSGRTPTDVNQLLKQFGDAQRMMKMMSGGRGMPNLAGVSAGSRPRPATGKKVKKKSKGRR